MSLLTDADQKDLDQICQRPLKTWLRFLLLLALLAVGTSFGLIVALLYVRAYRAPTIDWLMNFSMGLLFCLAGLAVTSLFLDYKLIRLLHKLNAELQKTRNRTHLEED